MRRTALLAVAVLAVAVVQAVPRPAEAASAAVVSPPDGTALSSTEAVLTATYDVVAGIGSRLLVHDNTSNRTVACADEVLFSAGMKVLRCHVRDLIPGHAYRAQAVLRDTAGVAVRGDTWNFTVDAPVATGSWPADRSTVAGSADDPAPGPGKPLTATYDRPLDPAASTALLFATSAGRRTAVSATTTVVGDSVFVEPAATLAPAQYSLVIHATDASGATSARTVEVVVGASATLPGVPEVTTPSRLSPVPESITNRVTTGTLAGLVVYDPAHPDVFRQLDPVPSVLCQISSSSSGCASGLLPVGDLPAGTYSWYSYSRDRAGFTASGPDGQVTVPAGPAALTQLAATAPTAAADPPIVHVTGATEAAAVVVSATSGGSTSVAVEPTAGVLDVTLPAGPLDDGVVQVSARAVDALGAGPAAATTSAAKESVPLRLITADPAPVTGPLDGIRLWLSESVRAESTLLVRDASDTAVPGTTTVGMRRQLSFTPQHPLMTQTYTVEVKAYAASCTAADLSSCEQVDQVIHQPVDATAPPPLSSIVVDPRLPLPTAPVTVSGRGVPGDLVVLSLKDDSSEVWSTVLGAADSAGTTPFSTGPLDLTPYPHALLPVTLTTFDQFRNSTTTHAGYIDRRYPTTLAQSNAGPLSIPWGTTTALSGRLTQYGGTAVAGKVLTVVQRRDNGSTITMGSVRTVADGTFRTVLVLTASGPLQARWAGTANLRPVVAPWTSRVAVGSKGSTPRDHPDTPNGARTAAASAQGVWLSETLRSATDVDWYAFGIARSGNHYIRLGHLPADYAITLYDRGGKRLGVSDHPGRQFEEMIRYLPAGTYYVRVSVSHGYSTTAPYHLSFARIADGMVILSRHMNIPESQLLVELMNNTGEWRETILTVDCVTRSGRVVRNENWVGAPLMPPRARRPFAVYPAPCPNGSAMRAGATSVTTSRRYPSGSWRLTPHRTVVTTHERRYPVTLTNTGTTALRNLLVGVLEYDAEGRVQAYASMYQDPLPAGASRSVSDLSIWRNDPAPNRYAYLALFN
jgi:hypothetical protein